MVSKRSALTRICSLCKGVGGSTLCKNSPSGHKRSLPKRR